MSRRRSWDESRHPRDDRGRFSRTPGRRWAERVMGQLERQGRVQNPGHEGPGPGRGGDLLLEIADTPRPPKRAPRKAAPRKAAPRRAPREAGRLPGNVPPPGSRRPTQPVDPNAPRRLAAIYGGRIRVSDPDDPRTAEHLAQLELIPDNMHRVVAGDMEARDGGIYVGARPAIDLDPDGPAATRDAGDANPRGWQTRGWEEVNGYYSGLRAVMTVGHTANADAAARRGGSRSAAAHEFGHALDRAMMARTGIGISNTASWAEIHRASMEDAEMFGGIGPYFQQPGRAGREEFFAEAFSVWVRHYDPAQPGQANNRLSWAFNLTGRQAGRISEYMVALNGRVDTPAAQRGTRAAGRRR